MPLPPPPAVAFSSTGKPSSSAATRTSASVAPPSRAGDERDAGGLHLRLRARLVPHPLHHVRARPDEDEVVVLARAHERRILGEKPVARMDCLAAGRTGGGDHVRDAQVALRRRRRPDADGLVGEPDVQQVTVGRRVDGDGLRAELVDRADDPDSDLAAVRYEDAAEHQWPARCRFRASGARAASEARTQGAAIPVGMAATEDTASRRRSRARGALTDAARATRGRAGRRSARARRAAARTRPACRSRRAPRSRVRRRPLSTR